MDENPSSFNSLIGTMVRQADSVFFSYDLKKNAFNFINEAFENVTQVSRNKLNDNPSALLNNVNQEDRDYVEAFLANLSVKNTSGQLEFRFCRPDGVERWIRLKVYPIVEDGEVRYITGEAEDDTARKLNLYNMQKINGWKNATLHVISHDLRGPIGVVKMLASEISKQLPSSEHQQLRDWLRMIEDISKRNLKLIKNVLSEESLSSAGVAVDKQRLDLVWEVKELMKYFTSAEAYINKTFNLSFSHPKMFAKVDNIKFGQIVTNLVDNAMKFTKANGLVKVHLEQLHNTVLLTVADNGIGIPNDLRPLLFTKNTAAARPGTEGEISTGLGLWIVKTFTDAHQGRVWFETEEQKGTTFYVELPFGD